jgi:hypothetical protein
MNPNTIVANLHSEGENEKVSKLRTDSFRKFSNQNHIFDKFEINNCK